MADKSCKVLQLFSFLLYWYVCELNIKAELRYCHCEANFRRGNPKQVSSYYVSLPLDGEGVAR